jgi:hypothetical protein
MIITIRQNRWNWRCLKFSKMAQHLGIFPKQNRRSWRYSVETKIDAPWGIKSMHGNKIDAPEVVWETNSLHLKLFGKKIDAPGDFFWAA